MNVLFIIVISLTTILMRLFMSDLCGAIYATQKSEFYRKCPADGLSPMLWMFQLILACIIVMLSFLISILNLWSFKPS